MVELLQEAMKIANFAHRKSEFKFLFKNIECSLSVEFLEFDGCFYLNFEYFFWDES